MPENDDATYRDYSELRSQSTSDVLISDSVKRLIIAGPGTGKSYLFQEVCKDLRSKGLTDILTLSFINELINDLAVDLYNLSKVRTLHSFALSLLPAEPNMFLNLGSIIENDYLILNQEEIDFAEILNNLADEPEKLEFYSSRRRYYNYFSPSCSVYTLIKYFEGDVGRIPTFSQLLIDEYQDFNTLEATLLRQLMSKSPVLIVGDDDQSLYDFKHAIPDDIREKATSDDFHTFELPYCSRCTEVSIHAYNKFVASAQENGFLKNRHAKQFLYFPSETKDQISNTHNKIGIIYRAYPSTIAYHIDTQIRNLVDPQVKNLPSVLIICPLRRQIKELEIALKKKGYRNIDASERHKEDLQLSGANLIMDDRKSNIGWRILFKDYCDQEDNPGRYREILEESTTSQTPFLDLLTVAERRPIKKIVAILRKIQRGRDISDEEFSLATKFMKLDPEELALESMRNSLDQSRISKNIFRDTPIKIVTVLGSKGLTRDVSFLVNFDDKYLLDREGRDLVPTDTKICGFLVALTRAREKTFIFTSQSTNPTYVDWIGNEHLQEI